jgi:hypothetical protein
VALALGLVCVLVPTNYGCLVGASSYDSRTLGSIPFINNDYLRFDIGVGLAGMRGPHEVNQWPMAKFLVPLGPLLPDEVLLMFSDASGKASSVLAGQ